jgi:hypothetical protein
VTAGRRGAVLVNAPTATPGAGASVARRDGVLVLNADATWRFDFDPCLLNTIILCEGGMILLFEGGGGMIPFYCPGMTGTGQRPNYIF